MHVNFCQMWQYHLCLVLKIQEELCLLQLYIFCMPQQLNHVSSMGIHTLEILLDRSTSVSW